MPGCPPSAHPPYVAIEVGMGSFAVVAHVDVNNYRPPPAVTDAVRASAVSSAADAVSGAD